MLGLTLIDQISGESVSDYYINYFLNDDADAWASNVRDFGYVRYTDLYDNIDLIVHGKGAGLKYDFLVKPGGDLNDIQLRYNHVDEVSVFADSIVVKTSVGVLTETIPISFYLEDDKRIPITVQYKLVNGTIRFTTNEKIPFQELLIDPKWSSQHTRVTASTILVLQPHTIRQVVCMLVELPRHLTTALIATVTIQPLRVHSVGLTVAGLALTDLELTCFHAT